MTIDPFVPKSFDYSEKEKKDILQLEKLVPALNRRNIPEAIAQDINDRISSLKSSQASKRSYLRKYKGSKKAIFEQLQKELGLVPQNYYRDYWMPLGMTVFGLPIGVVLLPLLKMRLLLVLVYL